VTFTNNSTSTPSDSFPGLAALVTGGSPVTTGLWYDDTYNRALSPPAQTDGLGNPGGACPGTVGTAVAWDEAVDRDLTRLDGGGGLNPSYLVRDPKNGCRPIMPHQYLRVNTIFEVVRAHGGLTAWTDKHPSYEWTNGPSGRGVVDFYGPEINSIPVPLPGIAGCAVVPFQDPTPDDGWTNSFDDIKCYDSLHVQAVLNQIDGYNHDRSQRIGVPTLFGTNFQAVSVGQKLAVDPVSAARGGYLDVLGTPGAGLAGELDFVDQSLGKFVAELKRQGLWDSTMIVVAAKHGQSPIDVSKRRGVGGKQPGATIGAADAFDISDDGSLIWLTSPSLTANVVATLSIPQNQQALGIQEIFAGAALSDKFDDPRLPAAHAGSGSRRIQRHERAFRAALAEGAMRTPKNQPFRRRLGYALAGIAAGLRSEHSLRVQFVTLAVAVTLLCVFRPEPIWWAAIALSSGLVITAELLNTALEHLADHLHPETHPRIQIVKDCAAAAVLVASTAALAVGIALVVHVVMRL
jgi:diacylglycerol kinase